MANRFTLLTVPHTGTHFAMRFFELLGAKKDHEIVERDRRNEHSPINAWYWHLHTDRRPFSQMPGTAKQRYERCLRNNRRLIVTARDPYLSVFHYRSKSPSHTLEHQAGNWNMFLDIVEQRNPFILDIGCRDEDREQHLRDAVEYLNLRNYDDSIIGEYAANWTPQNSSGNTEKEEYLRTGKLPHPGYVFLGGREPGPKLSWIMLDRAVAWYKNLHTNDYS